MENGTKPGEMIPDATDVANNKVMAILAYFGLLFLVPMLVAKDSPYARFHTNQGIILFIAYIAVYIVYFVLLMISPTVGMIAGLLFIGLFVLAIIGIINAATGKMKELPLIGKFTILK